MMDSAGAVRGGNDPSPVTLRLMKTPERDTLSRGRGLFYCIGLMKADS